VGCTRCRYLRAGYGAAIDREDWNKLVQGSKIRKREYPAICTVLGIERKGTKNKSATLWISDGESRDKVSKHDEYEKVPTV